MHESTPGRLLHRCADGDWAEDELVQIALHQCLTQNGSTAMVGVLHSVDLQMSADLACGACVSERGKAHIDTAAIGATSSDLVRSVRLARHLAGSSLMRSRP